MPRDLERIDRVRSALRQRGLDAIVCTLPGNVLMLSGYWPGKTLAAAIATRDGSVGLAAPTDEQDFWEQSWAEKLFIFDSRKSGTKTLELGRGPLFELAQGLGLKHGGRVGFENTTEYQPWSFLPSTPRGPIAHELAQAAVPAAQLHPASDLLERLRSVLTPQELEKVRAAHRIAARAFVTGASHLRPGLTEAEAAAPFRSSLAPAEEDPVARAGGVVWCLSGPNSAGGEPLAAHSSNRRLAVGDLVLVHCNSCADGFWTDLTRTFFLGHPDAGKVRMHQAVLEARRAALQALRPGQKAAVVDKAARRVLASYGFDPSVRNPLGHGVGFAVSDDKASPRLDAESEDVLEPGMVFNLEPAAQLDRLGMLRHCDGITLTERGPDVLSPFQSKLEELVR